MNGAEAFQSSAASTYRILAYYSLLLLSADPINFSTPRVLKLARGQKGKGIYFARFSLCRQ
jgi:hypothetical protein